MDPKQVKDALDAIHKILAFYGGDPTKLPAEIKIALAKIAEVANAIQAGSRVAPAVSAVGEPEKK
jgi:hypothetical protein